MIGFGIGIVIGFVVGVLVGRKNPSTASLLAAKAHAIAQRAKGVF